MQYWNHTSPQHSVEVEHRLTVAELEIRSNRKTTAQHGRRITALETEKSKRPPWTPRDWLLSAAGIVMVMAALTEKIGWTHAVAGLVKLYGGR